MEGKGSIRRTEYNLLTMSFVVAIQRYPQSWVSPPTKRFNGNAHVLMSSLIDPHVESADSLIEYSTMTSKVRKNVIR